MRLSVFFMVAALALGMTLPGCFGGDEQGMEEPVDGESLDASDNGGSATKAKKAKKGKKAKKKKKKKGA